MVPPKAGLFCFMKKDLLLLHGALGSKEQFGPLANLLQDQFNVHSIDFYGHGKADFADEFSVPAFARQVLQYLDKNKLDKINIFGYSLGGYVGLYLAKNHARRVDHLITFATKMNWNPEFAVREVKMLDPTVMQAKAPGFAEELKQKHGEKWEKLLLLTASFMAELGKNPDLTDGDFAAIETSILIGLGDRDKMVSLEESLHVYRTLKNAGFYILPHTKHQWESVVPEQLCSTIFTFMA
jgi:pimeloyl-ACP methyl ester carboxylesterase